MTAPRPAQLPVRLRKGRKTDVRAQFGALCWRRKNGQLQICLVTTRTTARWTVPKGWPMHKETPAAAAATEAWEEAGLTGTATDRCLGVFSYVKPLKTGQKPVLCMVYPVEVTAVAKVWPEAGQRKRKWFTPEKAARKVEWPELRRILATFDPDGPGAAEAIAPDA